MAGEIEEIKARLDGMDKAIVLLQKTLDREPSIAEVHSAVTSLKELTQTRFVERDVRTEQVSKSDKIAVDAALQAQKEAAGKQADNFSELINKNEQLFLTQMQSLKNQVDLLQQRLDKGEGHTRGLGDGWGWLVGAIGTIAAVLAAFELFTKH
jgi:hypothetical protein